MTSLQAIGFTLAGGSCVSLISLCAFGFAVRFRHYAIAPRCTARPKDTIYNPHPKEKSQNRGNPWFGWIPWTLRLSYETMLKGVPGTGTRKVCSMNVFCIAQVLNILQILEWIKRGAIECKLIFCIPEISIFQSWFEKKNYFAFD